MGELLIVPPIAGRHDRTGDVRELLRAGDHEGGESGVMLCEQGLGIGIVRYVDLIAAPADAPLADLPITALPAVTEDASSHAALWAAVSVNVSEVAVNAKDGTFIGIVPAARLLATCFRGHEDDLAVLSGYLQQGASARRATDETIPRRLWHRLPWLLVGLAGAMGASVLVSRFARPGSYPTIRASTRLSCSRSMAYC